MNYDADTRQRRTLVGVVGWTATFVCLTFTFAYCWRLFVGPYTEFYAQRVLDMGKARVYVDSDICRDSFTRARLEGFNECERYGRILQQSARVGAFYDLMNWMSICQDGVCTVAGVNITDSLWTVTRVAFVVACCLYVASILGIVTSAHGRAVGYYQLPQGMAPPPNYIYYAQPPATVGPPPSCAKPAPYDEDHAPLHIKQL